MKKSLLVVAACALGAITLSSCGERSVSETKFPDKVDLSDLSKVDFVLADKDKTVISALEPKATTVKVEFTGVKIPNYAVAPTNLKFGDAEYGIIYLRTEDASKNNSKYFTVSNTPEKQLKYYGDTINQEFVIDMKAMAEDLKADNTAADLNYFVCTLTLGKGTNGWLGLSAKPVSFPA